MDQHSANVNDLRAENELLKKRVRELELQLFLSQKNPEKQETITENCSVPRPLSTVDKNLTKDEVTRYGRQLILPQIGAAGMCGLGATFNFVNWLRGFE